MPHVTRSLTAVWTWKEASDSGAWYWTRSSIGMLLAGEQFAAAMLAILTAVLTSLLAPDWMARSAVIESLTPPAHDSMSVVRSWTIPRRSAARCAVDGRCGMAASVSPATSTTPAASIHLGVRSTGHPEGREAIPPRPSGPRSASPWSLLGSRPASLRDIGPCLRTPCDSSHAASS